MLKKLWKKLNKIKDWLHEKSIDRLLKEAGVDLSPEPGVWAILSPGEEEMVLAQLWENKLWVALMRKYAEKENRNLISKSETDKEFWYFKAKFVCYSSLLVRAKRAKERQKK